MNIAVGCGLVWPRFIPRLSPVEVCVCVGGGGGGGGGGGNGLSGLGRPHT